MKTLQLTAAIISSCALIVFASAGTASAQTSSIKSESELIAILQSDKPDGDKAIACKNLSVYGTTACVAELAKLLANEKLSSWARTPLEAIPGPAADEALRKAAESLQGRLLIGVINSIGVRRDEAAVSLLAKRLEDKDADVASAAAVALGKVGNSAAAQPLRQALTSAPQNVRSAVAEGCVLCAEKNLAAGNAAEAVKIYDEVRQAEVPRQRMLEATRGAILARGNDGIPLLIEQLRSNDKGLFQVALSTAREFPGREVDKALAAELATAFPERAALIILAMADRAQSIELAAVMKAATTGHKLVRLAAVEALGRVGNASCLAALLDAAVDADEELAAAAKESLVSLPGDAVDQDITARLSAAEGQTYPLLIALVGQRHIEASDALLKALKHSDRAVRAAALTSLGNTASQKYLSVLVAQVMAPGSSADDAPLAQAALKTAAVRMPDREACAGELAAAVDRAPAAAKIPLLEIIAAVGGAKALATVGAAAKGSDAALQDAGSRLLGDWSSIEAAPVLLGLAKGSGRFQTRALRGYIGMAKKFVIPEQQRAAMCASALEVARQPAEQKAALDVLKAFPHVATLQVAVQAMQTPGLKDDATEAAKAIAQKVAKTDEVKALLSKSGLEAVTKP